MMKDPYNWMNNSRQRRAGIILSYLALGANIAISIVYTPFLLKMLGQSDYGNYQYVSSTVSYLTLLTCGFGGAYLRFSAPYRRNNDQEGIAKINGLFLSLFLIMGSIALVLGAFMTWQSDFILGGKLTTEELATSKILMAILVINIFSTFPISIFNSYVIAQEKFIFQKGLAVFRAFFSPAICVLVLLHGGKSIGIAWATLCVSVVNDLITVVYCLAKLKIKVKISKDIWPKAKEVFAFSSFLLLSMIVDLVNWSVDKILLGKLCGTAVVAVYTVGATINGYYKSIGENISNVYVPVVYQIIGEKDENEKATQLLTSLGRIQSILLFLIVTGFIVFGQSFIFLWVGPDYADCYAIILLLMIPVTVPEIQKIGLEIQRAKNKHKFRSILYAIIAGVNIMISIPLSSAYGAIGAAIGTAITVTIGNGFIMNIYYHRAIKLNMIHFWKEILKLLPAAAIPCIIGVSIMHFVNCSNWITLILGIIVYVAIYAVCILFLGINGNERKKLFEYVKKRRV